LVIHSCIAVLIQLFIGFTTKNWLAATLAPVFFYVGREIAQAEYRAIEHFYGKIRGNAPWYCGFELRAWNLKSLLDFLLPLLICFFIYFIGNICGKYCD
jgi:hypothetical protein